MNTLDPKIESIQAAMKATVAGVSKEPCQITYYGATELDPANLVYWVCVQTDAECDRLSSDTALIARLRDLFTTHDYPAAARDLVYIGFASQETVDREWDSDWWQFFK